MLTSRQSVSLLVRHLRSLLHATKLLLEYSHGEDMFRRPCPLRSGQRLNQAARHEELRLHPGDVVGDVGAARGQRQLLDRRGEAVFGLADGVHFAGDGGIGQELLDLDGVESRILGQANPCAAALRSPPHRGKGIPARPRRHFRRGMITKIGEGQAGERH